MTALIHQTVLVTGANRGLGREFVDQLLERGVTKIYAAARDPRYIDVTDPLVEPLQLDVTDSASVSRAASTADGVSIVINNAGIFLAASVLSPDSTSLRRELEVNFFGPLAVIAAFGAA